MPDRDEMGVESNRKADTAKLVSYFKPSVLFEVYRHHLFLTSFQAALQLLPNGHQLDSRPEIRPVGFRNSEGPASSIYVSSIFPNGLKSLLEQVYGFSHLDLVDGGIVVVPPEVLDGFDLGAYLLESRIVRSISRLLLILLLSAKLSAVERQHNGCQKRLAAHGSGQKSSLSATTGLPVKIYIPIMLGWQRPHGLQHILLRIVPLFGGRASVVGSRAC